MQEKTTEESQISENRKNREINVLITTAMRLRRGIGCPWKELLPE